MPNWCENILEAQGPEEEIRRFLDETGPILSFDSIVPMPAELWDADSPLRPPWNAGSHALALWQQRQAELRRKYGATDWHDWAIKHWGTKWNACAVRQEGRGYVFDTAWGPPLPVIQALSAKYPDLRFTLTYAEPGNYFGGYAIYRNGNLVEETDIPDAELPDFFAEVFGWERDDEDVVEGIG